MVLGWCDRGHSPEAFLERLRDLGDLRTVHREEDRRFSYLTRSSGKLIGSEIEFGITLLSIKPEIAAGYPACGLACWARQLLALGRARAEAAAWSAFETRLGLPCLRHSMVVG